MFIIGTAGHVDHGKTLLIKALTGIDTDRLPEEKERGLTIDLGFAHFSDGKGHEIGVVDVPGHERFIRNMTAGAWGIDLALLVIAADDGWMYQTENHLRVLTAMGINEIIIAVTKIDIVKENKTKEIITDAEVRVYEQTGAEPSSVAVSGLTGEGVPELRKIIITRLESIGTAAAGRPAISAGRGSETERRHPLLYIDRAFNIKGAGLVVTGSLREGTVTKNDTLTLLPGNKEVRVRGIQTYDRDTETAFPACRTALNLTGVDAAEVKRGCCLTVEGSGFSAETEIILRLTGKDLRIRNHSEIEFAAGTAHSIATIHFLKAAAAEADTAPEKGPSESAICARIVLDEPITLRLGQPGVIIRKGGSRITGSGKVIWKGKTDREERIRIMASLTGNNPSDIETLHLAVNGYSENSGSWQFSDEKFAELEKRLTQLASPAGGVRREELTGKIKLPAGALDAALKMLKMTGKLSERGGTFFSGESPDAGPEAEGKTGTLSAAAKQVLSEAEKAGRSGLDLGRVKIPGARSELRGLTRAGLIVPLSENLFYAGKIFNELAESILEGLGPGATFDIALAKERTGLSRKYIIPLLNKMEEHGFVERQENLRRVIKGI